MKLLEVFKKDREAEKEEAINSITGNILNNKYSFNHIEQSEILNRVALRIFERKKESRRRLIAEAREVQKSMLDLKL